VFNCSYGTFFINERLNLDGQNSPDFLNDIIMQEEDSGSETDEELASRVAVEQYDVYRTLFTDAVSQSQSRLGCDESDFVVDSAVHSHDDDTKTEASGFSHHVGACQLPELLEGIEFFSGPAEWRHTWEWEVGECNRMTAEQNTQQFDEAEFCTDSDESVMDDDGSEYVDDFGECHTRPCLPCETWTLVGDSEDMANAVSASLVVNEPLLCSQSTSTDHAGTNAIYDREVCDSSDIQCVLDDVVKSCEDEVVTWDIADESGLTELDRLNGNTQISRDFASDGSEGRVLATCIPFSRSSSEHQDHFRTEDRCTDGGFAAGFAASSMFAQRSSYNSGANCRPVDSKWNPPRTSPTSENDGCRWKPKKKSWRKNSAGNAATKICDVLTYLNKCS